MINIKENEKLNVLNHSCAHLLAHAVKNLFPNAKFWVGPVIDEGFYYDIDLGEDTVTESDFEKIEREMKRISKDNKLIKKMELSKSDALEMFKDDPYKIDLINNMEGDITAYKQDNFVDLCRGPHVESTKEVKHFKLLKVSGAYFKGDAKNKMLQRIYGICFENEEDLNNHLKFLEEAKKRDHRKLGRDLDLFFFDESAPGMPYWLPKGLIIFNELVNFWRIEHKKRGYQEFSGPGLNSSELWKISGHWDHYKDDMFVLKDIDEREQALKPMSCPNAIKVFQSKLRSYKDLPLRFSDVDVLYRNEASGALSGLFRVRMFRQDDSHNFITEKQIESEIDAILDIADLFYSIFNLKFKPTLSTRPDNFMGDVNVWNKAEEGLRNVLNNRYGKDNYITNEGDGAFYGPKIDIMMEDALGRKWQMGTIQLDFQLPERFDLSYIDQNGKKTRPVIIHRVIYGSLERFMGILIEHFVGAFPLWLSPVQVNIIPINNQYHLDYSNRVKDLLLNDDVRVELDDREEKLGYKMRESVVNKIPYTLIIGDKEIESNTISYRIRGSEETVNISLDNFVKLLKTEISEKKI